MAKRVTIVFAERSFGRSSDVGENELGGGLRGDTLQVGAVPRWDRRGEEAWRVAQLGIGIEAYPEAVCIVLTSSSVLLGRAVY